MTEARVRFVVPLAIALLALARLLAGDPSPGDDGAAPPAPSAEATAVLGGLAPGDLLGDLEVDRVAGPRGGMIVVELSRGEEGVRLFVGRADRDGDAGEASDAPAATERFEIRYGPPSPSSGRAPFGDVAAVEAATLLGERIDAAEADVPPTM